MIKTVEFGNVSARYDVKGNGCKAVLFFPGSGQNLETSRKFVSYFSSRYRVVALEYENMTSVGMFIKYVDEVIRCEGISMVIIYGLSVGGFLARIYCRSHNGVVGLILSHTSTVYSPTFRKRVVLPGKAIGLILPLIPVSLLRSVVARYAGAVQGIRDANRRFDSPLGNKKYLQDFFLLCRDIERTEKNSPPRIAKEYPVLIIQTDNDPLAQDDGLLKEYYPRAEEHVFSGTGHVTDFLQFREVMGTVNNFLETSKL